MATKESINAARKLVKRYRSITIEEIGNIYLLSLVRHERGRQKAIKLTGFSSWNCSLCVAVSCDCRKCIYGTADDGYSCCLGANKQTYFNIVNAKTDKQLLIAFKNRADHIESILNKL